MARYASANSQGLAQGIFQVGGQIGAAVAPLLAAFIIVRNGQGSLAWFAILALLGMILMGSIVRRNVAIREQFLAASAAKARTAAGQPAHSTAVAWGGLIVLSVLMFSKVSYLESFRSFHTFYLIDRFGVSIQASQLMLFLFIMAGAVGVILGGMVGDRIGRYAILSGFRSSARCRWPSRCPKCRPRLDGGADRRHQPLDGQRLRRDHDLRHGARAGPDRTDRRGVLRAQLRDGGHCRRDHRGLERLHRDRGRLEGVLFLPLVGLLTAFLPRIGDRRPAPAELEAEATA